MSAVAHAFACRIDDLPSPGPVYQKVRALVGAPDTSAADLGRVVLADQASAARLLQLVNAPIFGLHERVETVTRAITLVGFRQLCDLVLACSLTRAFAATPATRILIQQLWDHALATSVCARLLALATGDREPERAFLAGLLHDVGRLALCRLEPEAYAELTMRVEGGRSYQAEEEQTFGVTHAALGAALAERWSLPAPLVEVVAHHHQPAAATRAPRLVALVHVADCLARAWTPGDDLSVLPALELSAWRATGLSIGDLEAIFERLPRDLASARSTFALDGRGPR